MTILQLKNADEKVVKEMQGLLAQLSSTLAGVSRERITQTVRSSQSAIFVAKDKGKIVGTATILFCRSLSGGLHGFIEDVVVDEAYRGKGIGKALMEKLIACAQKKGAHHINLTSRPERDVANRLYQTLGFKRRETNMYRLRLAK